LTLGKELEEVYRAVLVRESNVTSQLMHRYAQKSFGKNTASQSELKSAIYSLNLSLEWNGHEIGPIFRYLDMEKTGQLHDRALNGLLFKVTGKKPLGDLYEEVMEHFARLFNGD
jgi:hypothetical protein